jgi:hypothetical protein
VGDAHLKEDEGRLTVHEWDERREERRSLEDGEWH